MTDKVFEMRLGAYPSGKSAAHTQTSPGRLFYASGRFENFPDALNPWKSARCALSCMEHMKHMNWTTTPVSMVDSVHSMHPRTITLGTWLKAMKISQLIDTPKKNRPALMPHGMFMNGRRADNLVKPSGFMQLDIDTKHNPRLCVDEIKRRAVNDSSIILIAKSAGSGCWGLVRREPDADAQLDRIEGILGVTLDRCNSRSVAALRFASSDPEPYLKP